MRKFLWSVSLVVAPLSGVMAQVGEPYIHDPSTIALCDGKYYTYGTGGGGLISSDGWEWHQGAERPGGGAAPDVIKIGDRYLMAYGASGGGLFGGHDAHIYTMWNKTLDPHSPDFHFTDPVEVATSDGQEDCDAIDPGFFLDPTTGRLWLTYGTYWGNVRLVELDPLTGKRVEGNTPKDIAIDCEATDMTFRDGWYYLLGTHGTCCDGVNSTYNIVVGRSRNVTGPFVDNVGRDMLKGGGRMVINAGDRVTGPGHFGRTIIAEGVEKMSCHYEADFDQGGRSVLGIRPLVWKNGWPVAGERFKEGVYSIESERRGYALQLATDFVRIPQELKFWTQYEHGEKMEPVPDQKLADVIGSWPKGDIRVECSDYMFRPNQKWQISAAPNAGGYLGAPYYKIVISGTDRALAVADDLTLTTVPQYTGADTQLWRIDQLTDGTFRIMPKKLPGHQDVNTEYVLYSIGDCSPVIAKYDFHSDNSKWNFKQH